MIQPAEGTDGADVNGPFEIQSEPERVVLFVAADGTLSEGLIHALKREFPWVTIEQVDQVSAACAVFRHPVSLILVDASLVKAAEDASAELSRLHPRALTAVIELHHDPAFVLPEVLRSPLVRGVLPMNVGLDVWLSVVRLMLCGGEYFPSEMLRSYARNLHTSHSAQSDHAVTSTANQAGGAAELAKLTARELQVLERVSRGHQNKTIAAELNLSEHTVKIHLHNIISKLGAHNRTEAAAKFRSFQNRDRTNEGFSQVI